MLTVGSFLSYAIPDYMLIMRYDSKSGEYDGLYNVIDFEIKYGNRYVSSFNITCNGYLVLELKEETKWNIKK